MVKIKSLNFSYGKKTILHDIDFQADQGTILALIGPNGSGKSTLLRCLCGILKAPKGTISLFDKPLESYTSQEVSRLIAFLPQFHEKVPAVRVSELIAMGRAPYHSSGWYLRKNDREKVDWAIDYMNIGYLKNRMVENLSGGEKQRVWIAMILTQDTPFILLDEPVTYMDLRYQWDLLLTMKKLKTEFGKTIISVFHDINHALEIADDVYLLNNGSIYDFGSSEHVITEDSIHDVYGVRTHVCRVKECRRSVVIPYGVHGSEYRRKKKKECCFHADAGTHGY